jgi:hypothetical protein
LPWTMTSHSRLRIALEPLFGKRQANHNLVSAAALC